MTSGPDRDQALERLLRESVRPEEGTGDHLDAETAAAWVERRLGSREIAAIESHVSACDRCQELAAMIARTTPAAAAADARPRWRLAWLVPIGATAAALTIWLAVGQRADRTVFVEQTAEQSAVAPAEPVVRPEPGPDPAKEARSNEPKASESPAAARERALVGQAKQPDAAKTAETQRRAAERTESLQKAEPARDASSPAGAFAAPASPPSAPAAASAGAAAPAASAPGAPATGAATAPELARRATPSLPPATAQARSDALALSARNGVDILSVDPAERWRFGGPGVIQHSIDGGRNWTIAPIASDLQITAGSSPAASVCWLAGRAGVVMLTTDGQTWRRLSFPITVDLVSITATDARTATVTAADGRRFQTSDGGQTWQ